MLKDPVRSGWSHLCVDMQLLFSPGEAWGLPWLPQVLPRIVRLCEADPPAPSSPASSRRSDPARAPADGEPTTSAGPISALEGRGRDLIELWPELAGFAPPATVVDTPVYSPWLGSDLRARLEAAGIDTVLITGGETDISVLSTVLGAIDWGYRTILVTDCVCSASDEAHDAMLDLFSKRYSQHVETAPIEEVLEALS